MDGNYSINCIDMTKQIYPQKWIDDLDKFDSQCEDEQYTDTQIAWELLNEAREIIKWFVSKNV